MPEHQHRFEHDHELGTTQDLSISVTGKRGSTTKEQYSRAKSHKNQEGVKGADPHSHDTPYTAYGTVKAADIIKSIFVKKAAPMCDSWVANESEKHGSITVGPLLPKHMRVQFLFKCY